MKKYLLAAILLVVILTNVACSKQWRESDPGVDAEYVLALFDDISASGAWKSSNYNAAALTDVAQDPYSTIYFAESGPSMGAVGSIFAFSDTSFLGQFNNIPIPDFTNVFDLMEQGLVKVSVIFADSFSGDSRYFTLMLKLEGSSTTYFIAQGSDYQLDDNSFSVRMDLANQTTLILRSNDISQSVDGELAGTIQLKAFILQNGSEFQIGQFSVLHGFGGQN